MMQVDCTVAVTAKVVVIEVDADADIGVRLSANTPTKAAGNTDFTTVGSFMWIAPVKSTLEVEVYGCPTEVRQDQVFPEPGKTLAESCF
jgi:hypothetical protein